MELVDGPEATAWPVATRSSVVVEVVRRDLSIEAQVAGSGRWLDAEAGLDVSPSQLAGKERAQLQERKALTLALGSIQRIGQ